MKTAPIPPPSTPPAPKSAPWKHCTLCGAGDHVHSNSLSTMMPTETLEEMQAGDTNEIEDTAASGATAEATGEARDPTGEPQGDSPAGNVADPLGYASSPAESRHVPRPVDQDGREPTRKGKGKGKKGKAKDQGKKGKAKDQGKKGKAKAKAEGSSSDTTDPDMPTLKPCCPKCRKTSSFGLNRRTLKYQCWHGSAFWEPWAL